MNTAILDCYVDEPSCLGVPPYISPYIRYTAGAVLDAGHDVSYLTIDQYRQGQKRDILKQARLLVVIGGAIVPGKYLRGTPASVNEIRDIALNFGHTNILGGPVARFGFSGDRRAGALGDVYDHVVERDVDAFVFDYLMGGEARDRLRTQGEWCTWALRGASVITQHPDFPFPLMVELETYRGCVRYFSGGCAFCVEPLFGEPAFRLPEHIIQEVKALAGAGAVNFRLGAQSCIISYGSAKVGSSETPRPNPPAVKKLLEGIRKACPNLEVLHTDNANPAVIANHPGEAKTILNDIVTHCTGGNVLAMGMESADPKVIEANNLNATPDQVMAAVELVNEVGRERGESGLPELLPGINILCGLEGETGKTYELNLRFLSEILGAGLLLRRINIRQVAPVRKRFASKTTHSDFIRFKRKVREDIDRRMLQLLVPRDTVLKGVLIEKNEGGNSFGRQVGTYPLLVGFSYRIEQSSLVDAVITSHGYRSVTAIEHPMNVNLATLRALAALPGIGKKRARRLAAARPFHREEDFIDSLDDMATARRVLEYITF